MDMAEDVCIALEYVTALTTCSHLSKGFRQRPTHRGRELIELGLVVNVVYGGLKGGSDPISFALALSPLLTYRSAIGSANPELPETVRRPSCPTLSLLNRLTRPPGVPGIDTGGVDLPALGVRNGTEAVGV